MIQKPIFIHNRKANSIFSLLGTNENALTYALGYCLSQSVPFLIDFLKTVGILESIKGKNYENDFKNTDIFLQHFNDDKSGIKDILIKNDKYYIILEAKIDNSIPTLHQIEKYIKPELNINLDKYEHKYFLSLTRIKSVIHNETIEKYGIKFESSTWAEIFLLIRNYLFRSSETPKDFILNQLAIFFQIDYSMKFIDHEVLRRHVKKDYYYNVCNREGKGFYFDGGRHDFIYPSCQFFLANYGPAGSNKRTGEFLRRIETYQKHSCEEILTSENEEMILAFTEHLRLFPALSEDRFHVFTLGNKMAVHPNKIKFTSSGKDYKDLEFHLTE